MSRRPDIYTVSNPLYLSCIFFCFVTSCARPGEIATKESKGLCAEHEFGWMAGLGTAKRPHSLFDIFPIVCLIYFRIWMLISILAVVLGVFGKRRRERVEENKHDLDFLNWKSCEGRQIPVPYCAFSLWARSNTSQTRICFPCLAFMY